MQDLPHRYSVAATAGPDGDVLLKGHLLPPLRSAPPSEFGGPGDLWSPETLLAASVADCFVLTFRAIARASRLNWVSITCDVDATLDRIGRITRFTDIALRAHLWVPETTSEDEARRVLTRAKDNCLVSNSLTATGRFKASVEVESKLENVGAPDQPAHMEAV